MSLHASEAFEAEATATVVGLVDVHEELVAFGADEFVVDVAQVDRRPWQVGLFGNVI